MASAGSPNPVGKTQVSNRSYNVASIWETAAALDDDQLRVIEELNAACSQRPVPIHVRSDLMGFSCMCALDSYRIDGNLKMLFCPSDH